MISIGSWILIVTNLAWGFIAEKTGRRGLMVFLGILVLWGLTVRCPSEVSYPGCWILSSRSADKGRIQLGNRLLVESKDGNTRFGVLITAIAFQANWRKCCMALITSGSQLT
jgi:hypothetical protein